MHFQKQLLLSLWLACFLPAIVWASPAGDSCQSSDIESSLRMEFKDVAVETDILVFDHRSQKWQGAWTWQKSGSGSWDIEKLEDERRYELLADGFPFLRSARQTSVRVFVVGSNSVLYRASPGKITVATREEVAQIQGLVDLASGFLASTVRQEAPDGVQAYSLNAEPSDEIMEEFTALISSGEACEAAKDLAKSILDTTTQLERQEPTGLRAAMRSFNLRNAGLLATASRTQATLQKLALGRDSKFFCAREAEAMEDELIELSTAWERAVSDILPCRYPIELLAKAFETADPTEKETLLDEIRGFLEPQPILGATEPTCPYRGQFEPVLVWLESGGPTPACREQLQKAVKLHSQAVASIDTLRTKAQGVLQGSQATLALAGALDLISDRAQCTSSMESVKVNACELIEVDRRADNPRRLRWSQQVIEEFTIERYPEFKSLAATREAPVSGKYQLARTTDVTLGIDFGLVYTDLVNPTFSAVELPTDPGVPNAAKRFEIRRTDEDTRAGQFAAFLDVVPSALDFRSVSGGWHSNLGFQIGFGGDSDEPAALLGARFQLGVIQLGAGWTWQEVNSLRGQTEGQILDAAADLRTEDTFDNDWYISLTIALDDLDFFNPN